MSLRRAIKAQGLGNFLKLALAIEDTVASQSAAIAAGIRCHLYTGSYAIAGDAPLQTRDPAGALKNDLAARRHGAEGIAIAS